MGLIHANHGSEEMIEYLLGQLKSATNETIRHGSCLGLGLAAMGSARSDVYDQLNLNLHQDDAVVGEAAGIAMGLVMMGTNHAPASGPKYSHSYRYIRATFPPRYIDLGT